MSKNESVQPTQPSSAVAVHGKLPKLSAINLARIAAYLVQGSNVLSQSPVTANGTFQFRVSDIIIDPCTVVVIGPKGLDDQTLLSHSDLPRLALTAAAAGRARDAKLQVLTHSVTLEFSAQHINDKAIEAWWIWCRLYTVSGTLQTQNGCPIPGAEVTVYNVSCGFRGLQEAAITTVTTNAQGQFSATFNWCECLCCWPCWPIWWYCWPWWWELDMLAVIDNIERQIPLSPVQGGGLAAANVAPMKRPAAADLMTGQGFPRASTALTRDTARTSLIASKLANPQIRELFPWWWWCCENPNIVFSAMQNGNTILSEDPATSTRWCFASGQSVTLVGNSQSIGVCTTPPICDGFAWISVGNPGTLVTEITNGYANGTPGNDARNMAFAGSLNIYGGFSDPSIPLYQVYAGLWTGNQNPARGGVAPTAALPISNQMSVTYVIYDSATSSWSYPEVVLGPCSLAGIDNLYMTPNQRSNPPAGVTGLPVYPAPGSFPPLSATQSVVTWSDSGRMVGAGPTSGVAASDLIGAAAGGVDLTLVAYDAAGVEVPLVTNNPLTLMIDTTGLSAQSLDGLTAWTVGGTQVFPSSSGDCPSYHIGPGGYLLLHVTVSDTNPSPTLSTNEHVFEYGIQGFYGTNVAPTQPPYESGSSFVQRGYAQAPASFTPSSSTQPYGVDPGYGAPDIADVSFIGGGDTIQILPTVSCCYGFQLWAGKRVTDGETFFGTLGPVSGQTATVTVDVS